MALNNQSNSNNQNLSNSMLEAINKEIDDMQMAEAKMSAQGMSLADYSLPVATSLVRKERVAREEAAMKTVPTPDIAGGPGGVAAKTYQSAPPVKQQPLQKPTEELKGRKSGINVPIQYRSSAEPPKYGKTAEGLDQVTTSTFIQREKDKRPIRILKEDDWIKKQPWAEKGFDRQGNEVWYTFETDLSTGVYKPDIITTVPSDETRTQISYAGQGFGTENIKEESVLPSIYGKIEEKFSQ